MVLAYVSVLWDTGRRIVTETCGLVYMFPSDNLHYGMEMFNYFIIVAWQVKSWMCFRPSVFNMLSFLLLSPNGPIYVRVCVCIGVCMHVCICLWRYSMWVCLVDNTTPYSNLIGLILTSIWCCYSSHIQIWNTAVNSLLNRPLFALSEMKFK